MANNQLTFIAPTTSAVTSPAYPSNMYRALVVSADALATTEKINIQIKAGSTWLQVLMPDNTTPARLTATVTGLLLNGGPTYRFVKDATASACGIYIDTQLK